MATITANAVTGNFYDTASWVGGVVPLAIDDVVLPNGAIITADADIVVQSIRYTGLSSGAEGLLITANRSITMLGEGVYTLAGGNGSRVITVQGSALTVNIVGDIPPNKGIGNTRGFVVSIESTNSTINMVGNYAPGASLYINTVIRTIGTSNVVNITGNTSTNFGASGTALITASGSNTINLTSNGSATVAPVVSITSGAYLKFTGTGTCGSNHSFITADATSTVEFGDAVLTNGINRMAVSATRIKMTAGADVSWRFETSNPLVNSFLYSASELTGYPAEAKVEDGTVYGPSNEFEGTLQPVVINTAQLAADLLTEISTSSDPLAERLRNASTVQTTGAQLQSLVIAP